MKFRIERDYRGFEEGGEKPYTVKVEFSKRGSPSNPPDVVPHPDDWISVEYWFTGNHPKASVPDAKFWMSIEEAEELAHLLIYSIQRAKLEKAPVKVELKRSEVKQT
jgi:hypothetical protein